MKKLFKFNMLIIFFIIFSFIGSKSYAVVTTTLNAGKYELDFSYKEHDSEIKHQKSGSYWPIYNYEAGETSLVSSVNRYGVNQNVGTASIEGLWYYVIENQTLADKEVTIKAIGGANMGRKSSQVTAIDKIPSGATRLYIYTVFTGPNDCEIVEVASIDIVLNADNTLASYDNKRTLIALAPNNQETGNYNNKAIYLPFGGDYYTKTFYGSDIYSSRKPADTVLHHYFQFISSSPIQKETWVMSAKKEQSKKSTARNILFDFKDDWSYNSSYKMTNSSTGKYYIMNSELTLVSASFATERETIKYKENHLATKASTATVGYRYGDCTLTYTNQEPGFVTLDSYSKSIPYGTSSVTFNVNSSHGGSLSASTTTSNVSTSIASNTVTVSGLGSLSAGTTVKVNVTCGETAGYFAESTEYTITITRAGISLPTGNSHTYDGNAKTGLSNTTYYTAGGTTSATNAGNYTATATPTANYQWSDGGTGAKNVSWSIARAVISVPTGTDRTYNGSAQTGLSSTTTYTAGGQASATDAGTYTATATPTANYQWSGGGTGAQNVTWKINPKSVAVSWGTTTTFTYNGSAQAPTASASSGVTGETINVTRTTAVDAGSYTSTASISSVSGGRAKTSNYTLTGTTKAFSITRATISVPTGTDRTYNGSAQTGLSSTTTYTAGGQASATDAGTYTATAIPTKNYQWSGGGTGAQNVTWKINPKSVTVSWGSQTTFTYNNSAQAPTASAFSGVTGETINVTRTTAVDVGSYTSTASISSVSGGRAKASNYTLTGTTKAFSITRANRSITMNGTMSVTYGTNGSLAFSYTGEDVTATVASSNTGIATVSMGDANLSGTVTVTPVSAGTSTVTVTVPASKNYNQATKQCTVTVNRANGWVNLSATTGEIAYKTTSATFTVTGSHGGTLSVAETTNTAANPSRSGTTVTIGNTGSLTAGTKVTVRVTSAQTGQYNSAYKDYTLTIIKANISPTVNMTDYTYAGTKSTPTVSGNPENGTVTYYYSTSNSNSGGRTWSEVNSSTYLNAGTYYMYATVGATSNYNGATTPAVAFTISRAKPTLTITKTSTRIVAGNSETIGYSYNGDGDQTVSTSDGSKATATINKTNKTITITATAAGTATITINTAQGTNYLAASASVSVNVPYANYSIESTYYETLNEAYNAASSGATIKVERDNTDGSTFTNDKNITLNTNGKTITKTVSGLINNGTLTITGSGTITTAMPNHLITNNATMEIKDSVNFTHTNAGEYYTVINYNTLTVNTSGIISAAYRAIYAGGNTTINSGNITSGSDVGIRVTSTGNVIVNGGSISSETYGIYSDSTATKAVTMTGGTITSKVYGIYIDKATQVDITAGTITVNGNTANNVYGIYYNQNATLNMSGNTNITVTNSGSGQGRGISVNTGTANITGGTITAKTYGILNNTSAIVNISGTTRINADVAGLMLASSTTSGATINVLGGSIYSKEYGLWNNGAGKFVLGTNDRAVSNTNPLIQGEVYGYYTAERNGTIEFYDGILKGKTEAHTGTINKFPDNYGVLYDVDGEYKTATVRPYMIMREWTSEVYTEGTQLKQHQMNGDNGQGVNTLYSFYAIGSYSRLKSTDYTSDKIVSIKIIDTRTTNAPTTYKEKCDISNANDGSITAWLEETSAGSDKYNMYIGSNGKIFTPKDSLDLFTLYRNCTEIIGLSNLDTSNTESMFRMFGENDNITTLDLSTFNTNKVTTLSHMFMNCYILKEIKLPDNFVNSSVTDMEYIFGNCNKLESLNSSKWDTSNVTTFESAFTNCKKLTTLDVSKWNTGNVVDMNYMFRFCSSLTNLAVDNWNTSKVQDMQYMFGNTGVTSLNLSNWNVSKVQEMQSMFEECRNLTYLNLNNWDTSNVLDMNNMFWGCSALPTLNVSHFNTSKVTNMRSMFEECKLLKEIDVSRWNTSNVTNFSWMFKDCLALEKVDVSKFNTSKAESVGAMFYNCPALTSLDLSSFDLSKLNSTMYSGTIDGQDSSGQNFMLAKCTNLRNVVLGKNFRRIDGTKMFEGCTSLKAIIAQSEAPMTLSTNTGVKPLGNAVLYVSNLTSETNYEKATNYLGEFGAERIRPILELIGKEVIYVLRSKSYTEEGATVAKYTTGNAAEYTQYGYELTGPAISTEGVRVDEVDTWQDTTYKLTYTLKYKGNTVMTSTRTVIIYRLQAKLDLSTKDITLVEGNYESIEYLYSGDGTINLTIDENIATVENKGYNFILKGINAGTTTLKVDIPAITYTDIHEMVNVIVLKQNYKITKEDGSTRYYHTLKDALEKVENGEKIVVLADVNETGELIIDKEITLDLDKYKITTDTTIRVEDTGKVTILGEGKAGIENTEGTAIINNGTLIIGKNMGTEDERQPEIKGRDYAVRSEEGRFIFESGTLVGTIEPPYRGEPEVPREYYIKLEQEGSLYKAIITKDLTPPRIYAQDIEKIVCGSGKEINFYVYVEEPESKIDPDQFTKEDLIFEVVKENGRKIKVTPEMLELTYISEINGTYRYELRFKGIREDGELVIRIDADRVFNIAKMGNEATIILEDKITIDYESPDLSDAVIEFVRPEDGITNDGEYEVKISGVTDNYVIGHYEWQIKPKGDSEWETLAITETKDGSSFYADKVEEEGIYEIRAIVVDANGNYAYSNILELTYEKLLIMDTKPSITFEKELVKNGEQVTSVKIHAIIKSTTKIIGVKVNNNLIDASQIVNEGKYQIRTDVIYEAFANTMYKFTVTDENENVTTEVYNVTDITKEGAEIKYKIVDATVYEPAKIVFTCKEEIKLVTKLEGKFYAPKGSKYNTSYYKEIEVLISGDATSIDSTFVFKDTVGNERSVQVVGDISTTDRNIITVSAPPKTIYGVYNKEISLAMAENLVVKMKSTKKASAGSISSYYGVNFTEIDVGVSSENDISTVKTLGEAGTLQVRRDDGKVETLLKGNIEIVTEAQRGYATANYNVTGVYIGGNLVTSGRNEGSKQGRSFHVTIINK